MTYTLRTRKLTAPLDAVNYVILLGVLMCSGFVFGKDELTTSSVSNLELDNGIIRIRMDTAVYGGAIIYISLSEQDRNLVNLFDRGREIQQSYYAGQSLVRSADGQHPSWSPWNWNPIQVGDVFENSSFVEESNVVDGVAYTRTIPLLWDMNNEPAQCYMEQWITLHGFSAHVRCKLTCFRTDSIWTEVILRHQEEPAVYTIADLHSIFTYVGSIPWQDQPLTQIINNGPPWENWSTSENWAASVDSSSWGVGVYNQSATLFVGGLHGNGWGGPYDASTNYISPLTTVALTNTSVYEYEYDLVVGTLDEIRQFAYMKHAGVDFDNSGGIGLEDLAILNASWHAVPSNPDWNKKCDVSIPADDVIDINDLVVLLQYWGFNQY